MNKCLSIQPYIASSPFNIPDKYWKTTVACYRNCSSNVKRNAIDARLAAGKLTAAQATQMKANTTAHVTEEVNEVRGFGKKGLSHGGKGPKSGHAAGGLVSPGVATSSTAKYSSGMTMGA